jgi:uncharacterized membrane protein
MLEKYDKILDRVFVVTISIKAFNGIVELIAAFALALTSKDFLINMFSSYISEEFVSEPHDIFTNIIISFASHLRPDTQHFVIAYIAIHGFINIGLALALFGKHVRAYWASMAVLIIFIFYQIYRCSHTHSIVLGIFIILDILTVFLIHYECKKLVDKNHVAA